MWQALVANFGFRLYLNLLILTLLITPNILLAENKEATPTTIGQSGSVNTLQWPKNILDWDVSPVDLSFLNQTERPAGKRGFVKAQGDQLVFEDGTVAKFWGTNIAAYTLFETPKDTVKAQAVELH